MKPHPDGLKASADPRGAWPPREALALLAVLILVLGIEATPGAPEVFGPWNRLNAEAFGFALGLTGVPVTVNDAVLAHPSGFRALIVYGCTGLVPGLLVAAWVTSLRQGLLLKIAGLASGLLLVAVVNLARVLAAFHTAIAYPASFTLVHEVVGHGAVLLSTGAFMVLWQRRAPSPGHAMGARPRRAG